MSKPTLSDNAGPASAFTWSETSKQTTRASPSEVLSCFYPFRKSAKRLNSEKKDSKGKYWKLDTSLTAFFFASRATLASEQAHEKFDEKGFRRVDSPGRVKRGNHQYSPDLVEISMDASRSSIFSPLQSEVLHILAGPLAQAHPPSVDPNQEEVASLVVLGQKQSGKSTFIKQLQLLYGKDEELLSLREKYKAYIYLDLIKIIKQCLDLRADHQSGSPHHTLRKMRLAPLLSLDKGLTSVCNANQGRARSNRSKFLETTSQIFSALIEEVQDLFNQSLMEVSLSPSATYILASIRRICSPGYIPSDIDIFKCGPVTGTLTLGPIRVSPQLAFETLEGQYSPPLSLKRRDPAPLSCIVYFFDSTAYEIADGFSSNGIERALQELVSVCRAPAYCEMDICVFINKCDELRRKTKAGVDFRSYFPDYIGKNSSARHFISYLKGRIREVAILDFVECQEREETQTRQLYINVTQASDARQVALTVERLQEVILGRSKRFVIV